MYSIVFTGRMPFVPPNQQHQTSYATNNERQYAGDKHNISIFILCMNRWQLDIWYELAAKGSDVNMKECLQYVQAQMAARTKMHSS